MCTSNSNFSGFTSACIEIISRVGDDESSIQVIHQRNVLFLLLGGGDCDFFCLFQKSLEAHGDSLGKSIED